MSEEFHVEITDQSVNARLNVSEMTRFYAIGFLTLFVVLLMSWILFEPGKHGTPSMWRDLSTSAIGSTDFLTPLLILLVVPAVMVLLQRRYVRMAYPSAEIFQCDRSTLTISRVRWWDFHNREWDQWSWSLLELSDIRFGVLARSKGAAIYGLRFTVAGGTQRVLPGLKPRDAQKILTALKSFGADVSEDGVLERKLKDETSGV